jgi:lactoylglutathione lyase
MVVVDRPGRKRRFVLSSLAAVAVCAPARAAGPLEGAPAAPPPVAGQVTFLYFEDLPRAVRFYGDTLGLRSTFHLDWVHIFAVSPTASIGLVDATHGAHRPSKDKPVMISLVVDDVDAWYRYLVGRGVEVPEPPSDDDRVAIRAFTFRDPEGHTLEVFRWR